MKTKVLNIVVCGLAVIAANMAIADNSPPAEPVVLHVGISPDFDSLSAGVVLTNLDRLLLTLSPGVRFCLENGIDGSVIAEGEVPHLAYPSPAAQAKALAPQLVALRNWLAAPVSSRTGRTGALNPPVYLRSVAKHSGDGRSVVLLVGNVMYSNGQEPSFDFAPDRLPTISHLVLGENATPFGCAGRGSLLKGITVHWYYVSPGVIPFEAYGNESYVWWQDWIQAQSGVLGEFTHDWALLNRGLFRPVIKPAPLDLAALAGSDPKPEMRIVAKRKDAKAMGPPVSPAPAVAPVVKQLPKPEEASAQPVPVAPPVIVAVREEPQPATPPQKCTPVLEPTPVPELTLAPEPVPAPDLAPESAKATYNPAPAPAIEIPKEVDHTVSSVGLYWSSPKADLDESIRMKPGSSGPDPGELYWNTPSQDQKSGAKFNALGRYLHDYRHGAQDYEWIELSKTITVEELSERFEIWCDIYRGRGPVTFTAVLVDNGKVIASRNLTIAGNGDLRFHSGHRESSASWVRLPIEDMLRSTPRTN